ncbi:KAP family NTPase [Gammaproteobacteria bacterium]|nr:KAP family NTPase [Gammaproteobacteria bacterium]
MPQQQNKILAFIQETKWIFLAFFLFGAFHTVIESFLNTILVNPILSKFENNWIARTGLIIIIIYSLIKIIISFKNKKHISFKHLICLTLPTLIYIYYRGYGNLWNFIPLEHTYHFQKVGNYPIAYLDIIIGTLIIPEIITKLLVKKQSARNCNSTKEFYVKCDTPIEHSANDLLNRTILAENIARSIDQMDKEDIAFAIGIISPWGNGKTSFIHLIKEQLETINKDVIYYEFNPWKYSTNVNITSAFFEGLNIKLQPFHSSLTNHIMKYADELSKVDNNKLSILSKILCTVSSLTLEEQFKLINTKLNKINKTIIVVIDDLDRLDGNEILGVLKIIRNSANFNKLTFIAAYDYTYLSENLKTVGINHSDKYLDKIFNYPYKLPIPNSESIKSHLLILLKKTLSHEDYNIVNNILHKNETITSHLHISLLKNIRDVIRYTNMISLIYNNIKNDVYIIDLLNIKLLQLIYPDIYDLFVQNFSQYVTWEFYQMNLWKKKDEKTNKESEFVNYEVKKIDLIQYISNKYDEVERKNIELLFKYIFSSKSNSKALTQTDNVNKYFNDQLHATDIPQKDFDYIYEKDFQQIKPHIEKWSILQLDSFKYLLNNYLINSTEKCHKYINSILYTHKLTNIDISDNFESKISNYKSSQYINAQDLIKIIHDNKPSLFISKLIHELSYKNIKWNFLISKEQCIEISYEIFEEHLKNPLNFDITKDYYYNTIYYNHTPNKSNKTYTRTIEYNPKAKDVFKKYILINFNTLAPELVYYSQRYNDKFYKPWKEINDLWDSWDAFEKDIDNIENLSEIVKEFIDFYKKWNIRDKDGNIQPIKYDFNHIKVQPENIH